MGQNIPPESYTRLQTYPQISLLQFLQYTLLTVVLFMFVLCFYTGYIACLRCYAQWVVCFLQRFDVQVQSLFSVFGFVFGVCITCVYLISLG